MAPTLSLTGLPASMVDGDGAVTVVGEVADEFDPETAVRVDDEPVTIEPDGTFMVNLPSRHGLNIVRVEAEDAAGNQTSTVVSWLYAPAFSAVGALPVLDGAPPAFVARLGAIGINDGELEPVPDDLAQAFFQLDEEPGSTVASSATFNRSIEAQGGNCIAISGGNSVGPNWSVAVQNVRFEVGLEALSLDPAAGIMTFGPRNGGID